MLSRRIIVLAVACAPFIACGDDGSEFGVGDGPLVQVDGMMFIFGPNMGGLVTEGATVAVAEAPEISTKVAADGSFSFRVPSGKPISFSLLQEGFHPNQSATIAIGAEGLPRLGFQAPTQETFYLLGTLSGVTPDERRCQISTTVSRIGTTPYGGDALGVEGVVVSIDPPLPAGGMGPIYFAFAGGSVIYPDTQLTETSIDGGVIFANVPEGEYTLTATKEGLQFSKVAIRCRAGVLVNAAPPNGLQQL